MNAKLLKSEVLNIYNIRHANAYLAQVFQPRVQQADHFDENSHAHLLPNRIFTASHNSYNGQVANGTRFHYRQDGREVWAEYSGGSITKGFLIAIVADDDSLDTRYQHMDTSSELRTGKCGSHPEKTRRREVADARSVSVNEWRSMRIVSSPNLKRQDLLLLMRP
ncbi:hypothetical protein PspLS_07010 [Pyricularia sp. CBS 133598]|nr:hypothetical protein PspLS_07010 [Pyricularia sp. CBS 133598]